MMLINRQIKNDKYTFIFESIELKKSTKKVMIRTRALTKVGFL